MGRALSQNCFMLSLHICILYKCIIIHSLTSTDFIRDSELCSIECQATLSIILWAIHNLAESLLMRLF